MFFSAFTAEDACSLRKFPLYLLPPSIFVLGFQAFSFGGSYLSWVLITLASNSVMIFLFAVYRTALRMSWMSPEGRQKSALLPLIIALVLRAGVVDLFGGFGMLDTTQQIQEIALVLPFLTVSTLLLYMAKKEWDSFWRILMALSRTQEKLNSSRASLEETTREDLAGLRLSVQQAIVPDIRKICVALDHVTTESELRSVQKRITSVIDSRVHPLISDLAVSIPDVSEKPVRRRHWPMLAPLAPSMVLRTRLIAGLFLALGSPVAMIDFGWRQYAITFLPTVFAVAIFLKIYTALLNSHEYSPPRVLVLGFLGSVLAGACAGVFFRAACPHEPEIFVGFFFFVAFLAMGVVSYALATTQHDAVVQRLRHDEQEARLVTQRIHQELWSNRRKMATMLHGSVQAALQAASLPQSGGIPFPERVSAVRRAVRSALIAIDQPPPLMGATLDEALDQIAVLWAGSCAIEYDISPQAADALVAASSTQDAAIVIVNEAILNAIKHGKAREITLSFQLHDDTLVIRVSNDGIPLPSSSLRLNYGSSLFSQLASHWLLTAQAGRTVLDVHVPVSSHRPAFIANEGVAGV